MVVAPFPPAVFVLLVKLLVSHQFLHKTHSDAFGKQLPHKLLRAFPHALAKTAVLAVIDMSQLVVDQPLHISQGNPAQL